MDAVKAKSAQPVQPAEAPKRVQAVKSQPEEAQAAPADAKPKTSAYEQPKPTTNTRGEKLGQRLHAIA